MRVLDLGGTLDSWRLAPTQPERLVILNQANQIHEVPHWAEVVTGDACCPPKSVLSQHFDLVYSNSVLEHLGGHYRRAQFAGVVDKIAAHHWVQTPYRYFPIEPHWIFPWFQHLPVSMQTRVAQRWPIGNFAGVAASADALADVLEIELVGRRQLEFYFPTSRILNERFFGLTKSIIAVK